MLMLQAAVLPDADALAILAQLLEARLLAFACLEALRRCLMRVRQDAMALRVLLLLLAAVLRLRKRCSGERHRNDEKDPR